MYHNLFIHLITEGHLSCFKMNTFVNKATKTSMSIYADINFQFTWVNEQGAQLLDHMGRVC